MSSIKKKIVTSHCDNPEECSSQLLCGGTLKFLLVRWHKYHMPTFLVCTTHWRLTNNFLLLELTAWRPFRVQKSELPTTRALQLVPILLPVPKSLLHIIPITATAQDLHHAQYLQPYKLWHGPNDGPPHPPKKIQCTTSYGHEILQARTVDNSWNTLPQAYRQY